MRLCKTNDLPENFIVLTPNQRLAKVARERFDQEKRAEGKIIWSSHLAMPFQSYALSLGQLLIQKGFLKPQLLLKPSQIEAIWQNILSRYADLNVDTVIKAWKLAHEWGIDISSPAFLDSESSALWQQWAMSYQKYLQQNQFLDPSLLLNQTLDYLNNHSDLSFLPENIILLSFTDFTVFEKNFLACLKNKHKIMLIEQDFNLKPDLCIKKSFDDSESELETMVHWAYEKSKTGSVACVIPQLASRKNKISAIFGRYIEEHKALLNISLGNNLSEYSLIQAAVTGIKLLQDELSIKTISDFLLSPFYQNSFSTLYRRAMLDIKLKSNLQPITSKNSLLKTLGNNKIKIFFEKNIESDTKKSYSAWAELFQKHLNFLGWPGERALTSEEFQLIAHWNSLIENFVSLTLVSEKISFHTALNKLITLMHQSLFQPKRLPTAKIDILGTLEAAGLPFDFVWLAGMQENAWPSKGMANPFLPLTLQRKLNMPHSSAEQNFAFSARITQQLLSSAKEIWVTYAKTDQDNPARPSLLIQDIINPEENINNNMILQKFPKIAEKPSQPVDWEIIEDNQSSILEISDSTHYGSEIFKDQTACAFRAYAKHRLKAKKIELPQLGFKALTRGNLVHEIFENFFKLINNHETLCATDELDLRLLANNIIHKILDNHKKNNHNKDIFTIVEKRRLEQLLLSWIEKEKSREPFTIIATEETLKVHFGKLPLHLRIDRIDQIEKNQYLIIDYKTGKINFDILNPMDEPQLPLYCVVSGLDINNIAFAQLRTGDIKLKTFESQKDTWEQSLLAVADDFIQGNAIVKPKYGLETCRYCDLSSLCRIKEKLAS